MLLPRVGRPCMRAIAQRATSQTSSSTSSYSTFAPAPQRSSSNSAILSRLNWAPSTKISPSLIFSRNASHAQSGRANGAKDGPGKRLGAKKTGEQYVIPGNIIFRQRGTHWFPGENCGMGRDHTIFSTAHGYVKYYRDPLKHPKRQYIGVVFDRKDTLPYPQHAARKRKLGMNALPITDAAKALDPGFADIEGAVDHDLVAKGNTVVDVRRSKKSARKGRPMQLELRPGYMYREANWEIGRAAERAGVKTPKFKRGDRFVAWRKLGERKLRNAERRGLKR
ncbi:ribosomal protein L27 [Xylona heveae TC161]|uniref:Large ribosomal subunit protein bL27m n=1 Tax=Xylona heveae (strain CBS 132557 / TC161) TaxID=1328760 RepID=A0A165AF65_XYLHT|nr:ribosomal protein L27 [Xylona heveae TC161]KZF20377.1 ribosomal protein L27 [Xylona heveae TC161]